MTQQSLKNCPADRLADRLGDHTDDRLEHRLDHRFVEAARYAVLSRLLPVLRHDVAGAMQAPRMLLMVMEKRLQAADPDLQAIQENVRSVSTLTKQATASSMTALSWIASSDNTCVDLRSSIDETIALLAMELSMNGLTLANSIEDDAAIAPQSFLRSVFTAALLAFCDQHVGGGTLQVTFRAAAADAQLSGQLHLQLTAAHTGQAPASPELFRKSRLIEWSDVQAIAQSMGATMARGDGWLTVDVPKS